MEKKLSGEVPFTLAPINWAAKKVMKGSTAQKAKKAQKFWWNNFQKPIAKADVTLGAALQKGWNKMFGSNNKMFTKKVIIPGKKRWYHGKHTTGGKEVYIPSAMKPVAATAGIVVPIAGSMKIEEALSKRRKKRKLYGNT